MGVHDALFKAIFSQTEHAAGELSVVLPRALAERIDFSTLQRESGSFVDSALTERFTDLLYSARIEGREALLYLLFEHLSHEDPLVPFRLLRYMVRIWEEHLKKNPDARRLPIIVPVVLHHSAAGWAAATTFESLLDADEPTLSLVAEHVPRFRMVLDDISLLSDQQLRARTMSRLGRLGLGLLARDAEEFLRDAESWNQVVTEAQSAPGGLAALEPALSYIFRTSKRSGDEIKARLIKAWGKQVKEVVVTAAEMLEEKGRSRGQREIILRQLQLRFGKLPEPILSRVSSAGPDDLTRWGDLIITASTLDDIFTER